MAARTLASAPRHIATAACIRAGHVARARCLVASATATSQQTSVISSVPAGLAELLQSGSKLTTAAKTAWTQFLRPGDTVVDATCGNGHDTLFLAQAVGPSGHVIAFDIQEAAISATRQRLEASLPPGRLPRLELHAACHSRLQELAGSGVARLVVFNLGYLPGADKSLITSTATTSAALEAALEVVEPGGLISILCYVGHPGGMEEYNAVRQICAELKPAYWATSETRLLNRPTAPVLVLLWRCSEPFFGRRS
ncbi:hypothetical protein HYH03_003272 [Edaphochlamys debaryana]|uniref:rRNA methylase n=1 Tax=Edaphochlamys debaryana TaxID=47281 RepID=A0A836C4T0_9CHLO|nr:hypothetical protein HYH03_003272 [Edaphochlamys debaryana]|eukprot:KAG2499089.1 hypothetical protein HYH03_003272 [Edaphochlamys debaryana]